MKCSRCGTVNPASHVCCSTCGSVLRAGGSAVAAAAAATGAHLGGEDATTGGVVRPPVRKTVVGTLTPPGATPPPPAGAADATAASWAIGRAGQAADEVDFGPRYRLGRKLGEGGMGAVYKAYDKELDRTVALKLVRPGLAEDPMALQRFKQELLLASKISHKNILRIHDLGEYAGTRFISMAFIEGEDLHHLLERVGRVPLERALNIARQLCLGLDAAHAEGVIHRDFKPQNILLDAEDHAYISDFGLSKSLETDVTGMTRSGEMLGTPRYMPPEQIEGSKLDQRVDIYALGLILYEMVTGDIPFQADSTVQLIYKHVHELPRDPREVNSDIPEWLARVIMKCLEKAPEARYTTAAEVLEAINTATAPPPSKLRKRTPSQAVRFRGHAIPRRWIVISLAAALLAAGGLLMRSSLRSRSMPTLASAAPQVSLAILPFRNASGDASLDWLGASLAEMLSTDVGQSAKLRTISPDRLHQVLADLQVSPNVALDTPTLLRVAQFSNADTLVWGQYAKFGDQIRIDATVQDLKHDRRVPLKVEIATEKDVPGGVDRMAESIRQNLGMSPDVLQELQASSFQPTSTSLPALRDYNDGVKQMRDGKSMEAQRLLEKSVQEDPAFALAFSRLAQVYSGRGYDTQAEEAARRAVSLADNLPRAEKYLIAAIRARVEHNLPEAIKAYETLARVSPDNSDVQMALARLYEDTGDFTKSREWYRKVLAANPKDVLAVLSLGRVAIKSGDPQGSLDPLNQALSLSTQLDNDETRGTSLHLMGVAYRMLNKRDEALRSFQEALAIRRRTGEKSGIAYSLNEMAFVEAMIGKADALPHYQEALKIRREIGDKRGLADTLIDLGSFQGDRGNHDEALKMHKEALQLERDIGNESLQAICLNNIGSEYFFKSQFQDALTYFQQALQLREKANVPQDIVESIHNLAETSARMGDYDKAITQYMRALDLRRSVNDTRGAAIESYSLGTLFDLQGRFGAAIKSKQESLKAFRDLKDRTFWMSEILDGNAEALTLAGHGEQAEPLLQEALGLARDLKNDALVAQTFAYEGDAAYYRGDNRSARGYYQRALQAASHTKEPDKVLIANVDLARVDLAEGHAAAAIRGLRALAGQAEEQGFANVAVECSAAMAEAMLRLGDTSHARQELDLALARADKLGLKPLSAKAHFLLAMSLRASGNLAEAQQHFSETRRLLDAMRSEPGAESILQRSDFKAMYEAAMNASSASHS